MENSSYQLFFKNSKILIKTNSQYSDNVNIKYNNIGSKK